MTEFFHMGGYAVYVWGSYAIGAVVLILNVVLPTQRHKQVLRDIRGRLRREQQS